MWRRFRPPLGFIAVLLLALIGMLAVLQYRWLGQISEAERAQRRATLAAGAQEFAQDFDREIARAYVLFQGEPPVTAEAAELTTRFAARYDHWQANSRFPRLLKESYSYSPSASGGPQLRRFDPVTRRLEPAAWPASMSDWREHLADVTQQETEGGRNALFVRKIAPPIWESVPAIVVPTPVFHFASSNPSARLTRGPGVVLGAALPETGPALGTAPELSASVGYSVLVIDREYVARELLPALAARHFSQQAQGESASAMDFKVAVVSREPAAAPVFQSTPSFAPRLDDPADATADLFQVRTQDFTSLVSEVRRFTAFTSALHAPRGAPDAGGPGGVPATDTRPMSILIQKSVTGQNGRGSTTSTRVTTAVTTPLWKLMVAHRSGSLEAAVSTARRRNLVVSFSILGILVASMGVLVVTTRGAQRLATQQMEFVAAVSHELRTPLAVIRSAAENLADGVVHDEQRIRRYGEVMRTEGRRLTDMVEQILEFAGIQSGQRGFALRPVWIAPLIQEILSSSTSLIDDAGMSVELDLPPGLPAALGDEPALRRVFQNLIDNAVKYGASGGWMRVSARASGSAVLVTVSDRGIGIDPAEQNRIFEPFYRTADVVAAQMQGAGLGLSLVQRIVAAHGGRVTVKSTPRSGADFTVQLPSTGEASVRTSAEATPSGDAPDGSRAAITPEAPPCS